MTRPSLLWALGDDGYAHAWRTTRDEECERVCDAVRATDLHAIDADQSALWCTRCLAMNARRAGR